MSRYIKLEDAISIIVNTPTRVITDDLSALADRQHEIIDMLADLPTIEMTAKEYLKQYEYAVQRIERTECSTEQSSKVGEWKWKSEDICDNCGYEIPHNCENEPTDCETCLHAGECDWEPWQDCNYESKTEPQTERIEE